jgi:hypothetical protein
MNFDQIYNLVTLLLVSVLKFTLFFVLLIKTHTWTWLGRGLLIMFLLFGVAYSLPFLRLVGWEVPYWLTQGLRLVALIDSLVILVALLRYDWEDAPSGIQWGRLLGIKRDE